MLKGEVGMGMGLLLNFKQRSMNSAVRLTMPCFISSEGERDHLG
jgi:hypothetical protein